MADVYDRFGRLVFSIVLAMVRDGAVAEDLVQDTFLRVWNRSHEFEGGPEHLGRWVVTIARNRAIDYLRSVAFRMERRAFELDVHEHPSLSKDMEREVVNADHARIIRSALSRLNPVQKKVIEMAYYEGLSQAQIAERLGQPLGTVKGWARAALRNLREDLGQGQSVSSEMSFRMWN